MKRSPILFRILVGVLCFSLQGRGEDAALDPRSLKADRKSILVGPIVLRDESLDQVLALLERWTGKVMLRPQLLPPTAVSLTLKEAVPVDEAIGYLETLLSLNGLAIVPFGEKAFKIVPVSTVKSEAPELISGSSLDLPASGRIVSKLFQLDFIQVAEIVPQIAPLLSSSGSAPVILEKANAAIITDALTNVQRVELLIKDFDQPRPKKLAPRFYSIQHARAVELVSKMKAILTGPLQQQVGASTVYMADEKANQVVVVTDPRLHGFFDDLIARFDVQAEPSIRNEIIHLQYASAKDVSTSVSQLVAAHKGAVAFPAKSIGVESPSAAGAGENERRTTSRGTMSAEADLVQQFSSGFSVIPEERSNAIIVSGTSDDLRLIKELIREIDLALPQVRIEVVIVEVALSDSAASGINALGLKIAGDKLVGFSGSVSGLGVSGGTIARPGTSGGFDLAADLSLSAVPKHSAANIISVPTILTTHSKTGSIFVGESRPVISSYLSDGAASGGAGAGYRTTVASKDIGIQLSVKPLIGRDGAIQLEIKQEVNDVLGDILIDGNPQPRIGRRLTDSYVSARSGDIVVLGGMQRSSRSQNANRLGPLPWIGDILGGRTKERGRSDLVIFLRPTVMGAKSDAIDRLQSKAKELPPEMGEILNEIVAPSPRP